MFSRKTFNLQKHDFTLVFEGTAKIIDGILSLTEAVFCAILKKTADLLL